MTAVEGQHLTVLEKQGKPWASSSAGCIDYTAHPACD